MACYAGGGGSTLKFENLEGSVLIKLEGSKMSNLAKMLNIEEGQKFKVDYEGEQFYKIVGNRRFGLTFSGEWVLMDDENSLCELIAHPERIHTTPKKADLRTDQYTMLRGRWLEGWNWIAKNYNGKCYFYVNKPSFDASIGSFINHGNWSSTSDTAFNYIKPGECYYLPDLLEE